jgi:hypothetical protein
MPIITTGESPYDRSGELLAQGIQQGFGMAMDAARQKILERRQTLEEEEAAAQKAQREAISGMRAQTGTPDEREVAALFLESTEGPEAAQFLRDQQPSKELDQYVNDLLEQAEAYKETELTLSTLRRYGEAEKAGILGEGSYERALQDLEGEGTDRKGLEKELKSARDRWAEEQTAVQRGQKMVERLDQEIAVWEKEDDPIIQRLRMELEAVLKTSPDDENEIADLARQIRERIDPEGYKAAYAKGAEDFRAMLMSGEESLNRSGKIDQFTEPGPGPTPAPRDEMPGEFKDVVPPKLPSEEDKSKPRAKAKYPGVQRALNLLDPLASGGLRDWTSMATYASSGATPGMDTYLSSVLDHIQAYLKKHGEDKAAKYIKGTLKIRLDDALLGAIHGVR